MEKFWVRKKFPSIFNKRFAVHFQLKAKVMKLSSTPSYADPRLNWRQNIDYATATQYISTYVGMIHAESGCGKIRDPSLLANEFYFDIK